MFLGVLREGGGFDFEDLIVYFSFKKKKLGSFFFRREAVRPSPHFWFFKRKKLREGYFI